MLHWIQMPNIGSTARRAVPKRTSFAPRLRSLRRQLMATSVVLTLLGLSTLAWLVVRIDEQARADRIGSELETRTATARSLLYYEDGVLRTDGLLDDSATNGSPQVFAIESDGWVAFDHGVRDFDLDLVELADRAVQAEDQVAFTVSDREGLEVRVLAEPFYHDETDEVAGAVVVTADARSGVIAHDRTARVVWLGSVALAGLLGMVAWLVINRSLAPASMALAQQERFVADAAHELRRPLTSLRATAERGLRGDNPDRSLDRIVELVDDASGMVDNMLVLARLDASGEGRSARTEPVRLDQLVESMFDGIEDVDVQADEAVVVHIDASLVRNAVFNLVANARQHGEVPIEVVIEQGRIRVLDRGSGFSDQEKRASMDRFRSGSASTGYGLGLSLVQSVARVHGGKVEVGNRSDGSGAEVVITFA